MDNRTLEEKTHSMGALVSSAVTFGVEMQKEVNRMQQRVENSLIHYKLPNGEWTWLFPYEVAKYEKTNHLPKGWRNRK